MSLIPTHLSSIPGWLIRRLICWSDSEEEFGVGRAGRGLAQLGLVRKATQGRAWFQLGQVGQLGLAWFQLGQIGQLGLAWWGQGQAGQLGFGLVGAGAGRAARFWLARFWLGGGRGRQGSWVLACFGQGSLVSAGAGRAAWFGLVLAWLGQVGQAWFLGFGSAGVGPKLTTSYKEKQTGRDG
ncbi:hypothetical protein BY996DRAFT_6518272 [Phakopsora pachyrhizi]|nr:hypothetical protein BY996DRAFT_6518272 [Phakopsora pachyrhizi]